MASELDRKKCWQWSEHGIAQLEEFISEDQLDIIRLAFVGLGILIMGDGWFDWNYDISDECHPSKYDYFIYSYSNPDVLIIGNETFFFSPLSFSELCMILVSQKLDLWEDAPYLLYVALVGVGVDEMSLKEVGFDCGTEINIEFLHTEYTWFSVLLAVGNMVMSMSDSDYEEFCNSQSVPDGYNLLLCKSRCSFIAWSKFFREFDRRLPLGFQYASYVDDYFDRLRQKVAQIALQNTLRKGMKEGYVSLNNIKMVICGPPFVGKTAFKHLLLNKPPPLKHNSTPIAARPIQAIERIAAGDNTWEETNEEDVLQMLSDAIEKKATQSLQDEYSTNTAIIPEQIKSKDEKAHSVSSSTHVDIPATSSASLVLPPSAQKKSLSAYKSSAIHEPSIHDAKAMNDDYVLKKIAEQLASSKERKESQKLLEATWIHLLDSGGQPQFIDLLHMFVRDNSLYIVVMKVTESLHDKPMFVYSLNGSPLSVPQEITMTNLQIIESFVRSVAVASRYKTTKPAFAIVATNCDRSKFRRFVGLDEKLKTKNKVLQECLSEFLDLFIFYNHDSNELIFPVDNLCRRNRQKISADIRSRLLCSRSDISFNVKIPIRWYVFDLNMKKEASKETHGIITLESCFIIGNKFGMNKSEVTHCLNYLDSMRLCIYYPNIIPDVVFNSPQFLIDCLSNIVRVSFVDNLQQVLPEGVCLSGETVLSLKRDGVFDESLLDNLGLTFLPNLFSKSDLLSLLQHFRLISPIKAAHDVHQYFIPVLLPAERLTKEQKAIFGSSLDPLIITFKGQLVLQGLFPALIVSLLSRQREPLFYIDSFSSDFPKQLRHAVKLYSEDLFGSVFLCEDHKWIEVYFTGPRQHCCLLRKVILEGLSASAGVLGYDEEALDVSALVHCNRKHSQSANNKVLHPITISYKTNPPAIGCSMESGLPTITVNNIDERQSCWLIGSTGSVIESNALPADGTSVLDQSHALIILEAIKTVVFEWENLGLNLGIEKYKLDEIKYNCRDQVQVCRKDMVYYWIETKNATCDRLIIALNKVGEVKVADDIKKLQNA